MILLKRIYCSDFTFYFFTMNKIAKLVEAPGWEIVIEIEGILLFRLQPYFQLIYSIVVKLMRRAIFIILYYLYEETLQILKGLIFQL